MSRLATQTPKSNSASLAIEESKRKSVLLKDNSWIKKNDEEDEPVDRDPNFGRSVLSRYQLNESLGSSSPEATKTTTTKPKSTSSVQALTKRFSGSQDELRNSSTLPSSKTTSSYTKRYSTSITEDPTKTVTTTSTIVTEEPKTSTKTTTVIKNGSTTETTTTTQSIRSPGVKSPTLTETFSERVKSSSKGSQYTSYSPTKTTKVTEKTTISSKDAEDKLYETLIPFKDQSSYVDSPTTDSKTTVSTTKTVTVKSSNDTNAEDELYSTLIPMSVKNNVTDSKTTVTSTETVTVKSILNGDDIKTTTTTKMSSMPEDELYSSLLPISITSNPSSSVKKSITRKESVTVDSSKGGETPTLTSPSSTRTISYSSYTDDAPTRTTTYSPQKTYSYSRPDSSYEYSSITSPTVYTPTSYISSRSDVTDPIYSKSSMKSVYGSSERHEKDLCTICYKPFNGEAKMVLDDMKIKSHATCFKCDVCNTTLGNLKAGDSMWLYKRMVHCENCFEITRDKWRR